MTLDPAPQEPVVVAPAPPAREPVDPPPAPSDFALETARVGDVLNVPVDHPVPAGWEVMDGQRRVTSQYREFAQATGITAPVFDLPAPVVARGDGAGKYIVRVR